MCIKINKAGNLVYDPQRLLSTFKHRATSKRPDNFVAQSSMSVPVSTDYKMLINLILNINIPVVNHYICLLVRLIEYIF